jgi:gliding motility-associated lipoprotein GldD
MRFLLPLFFILGLVSCKDDVIIKPKAQLRLDYSKANYKDFNSDCFYSFQINERAILEKKRNCGVNLHYPKMKATLYLTYQNVNESNLDSLLRDAQKLTYDHAIKAESIPEQPFINPDHNVYGMFYMINGDAATQAQFYATDSVKHFITGALYFEAKPNFDSIYPAVVYLRNDIREIMETLEWKLEE